MLAEGLLMVQVVVKPREGASDQAACLGVRVTEQSPWTSAVGLVAERQKGRGGFNQKARRVT